jgi:hypothetical protein
MRAVRGQRSGVRGHLEEMLLENRSSRMVWGRANTGFAPTGNTVWEREQPVRCCLVSKKREQPVRCCLVSKKREQPVRCCLVSKNSVFWVLENGVWDGVLWLMARLGIVGNERLEARERGRAGRIQDSPLRETPSGTVFFGYSKIARGTVFSSVRLIAHRSSLIAAFGVRA